MSTKINVIVGDQRLLQDNKTRAAANQQALDSRTQQQQLEQQATNAVEEVSPEEPASDVPSSLQERHPAAQRRRKKPPAGTQFVGLANLNLKTVPGTNQLIVTSWEATSAPFPFTEGVNRIEVETTEYRPSAELLTQQADKPIASSTFIGRSNPYTIPLNTKQLDWYTAFRADNFFPGSAGLSQQLEQVRTPPALPFAWEDLRRVGTPSIGSRQYTISSSAADAVYVSTLFRVLFPPDQLTFRATDPSYYTNVGKFQVSPFPAGLRISLTRKTMLYWTTPIDFDTDPPKPALGQPPVLVYQDIAVYTKINTTTKQVETRFQSFSVIDTNDLGSVPALQFLTYLYADDPLRTIHLDYVNNFSAGQQQREALPRVAFSNYYWPNLINYNKTTGIVVALADTSDPNKKDVMNVQLNPDLSYSVVLQEIGGDFWSDIDNYTRASFERRGFTYVNTVEIAPSLAAVYDAVVPVQAV
jgi:hypothetical protein